MAEYIERQAAIDVVARWFKEINLNGDICILSKLRHEDQGRR